MNTINNINFSLCFSKDNKRHKVHEKLRDSFLVSKSIVLVNNLLQISVTYKNPWRYSPEEPRPTEAVAARRQYRGPCG